MKVEFFKHNIAAVDRKALEKTLKGLFLTTGVEVARFEKKLARYLGAPYVVGVTSATAGLHLALEALGVGEGDEVITTPMTFVASANAIIHAGARPVFVDVERDTGNLDPSNIEKAITKKTKAILPVSLYGQLPDMRAIKKIARRHKLKVIEDNAHALEARRDGYAAGEMADAAAFSFYATKNITSGEGGAISVHSRELAEKLVKTRLHGLTKDAAKRHGGGKFTYYDMDRMGWKYNMFNIQAALLINQIDRIERNLKLRQKVWGWYLKELKNVEGIEFPAIRPESRSALHLFTIQVAQKKRGKVLNALIEKGIGVSLHFKPAHLMSYYRKNFGFKKGDFPNAEAIGEKVVTLPFYPTLKRVEVKYVAKSLKEILGKF